jgi:hypothetical protein
MEPSRSVDADRDQLCPPLKTVRAERPANLVTGHNVLRGLAIAQACRQSRALETVHARHIRREQPRAEGSSRVRMSIITVQRPTLMASTLA